ncbi:hypothetical protein FBU30_009114 [Linnemannia zychae]|nr:hypothetical protein FBU30_009114 [Linnemannia zychae]
MTREEVSVIHEDAINASSSATLGPSQQAESTMSINSTHSNQQYPQPIGARQSISSEKASTLARQAIIAKIGLDHYLLMRFLKVLFCLSMALGIMAVSVLVPLYAIHPTSEDPKANRENNFQDPRSQPMTRVEILEIGNVVDMARLWAAVLAVALFSAVMLLWSWSELMVFLKLRQEFLSRSASRYSSRVVLLQNIPKDLRTVEALRQIFASAPGGGVEHVYLVRDVSRLEKAVKQRQVVLDKLEETESRYLSAIARAAAVVSFTTLNMRSRSWFGRCIDNIKNVKSYLGLEGSKTGDPTTKKNPDEDYVGHLKLYQLGDVPKLSLTDLFNPNSIGTTNNGPDNSEGQSSQTPQYQGTTLSNNSNSSGLAGLKWYQKPRRPRHYVGIPLISKRQDSIRYYRGELCRLNKLIEQEYEQQARIMAGDHQDMQQSQTHSCYNEARAGKKDLQSDTRTMPEISHSANESIVILNEEIPTSEGETAGNQSNPLNQVEALPAAFILMRTRTGANAVASGTIGQDKIPVDSRILGIPPRDIEWRVLGQATSNISRLLRRAMVISVGILLMVGSGLVVTAIASMVVFKGWERIDLEKDKIVAGPTVYLKQGILAPFLLTLLMVAGFWILNELCQFWGRVSKTQTELLTQRCYFYFLTINMVIVHPFISLSLSWQEFAVTEIDSLSNFLVYAIPSYCTFAFSYILTAGLLLPLCHVLQLPRLWATLPEITLWSALGPLSWRKSNRLHKSNQDDSTSNAKSSATAGKETIGSAISSATDASGAFEENFSSVPTQTPRQAFQTRQPPFFNLHNLYPHLVLLFTISFGLLPLAPALFLLWIVVLMSMNLCYRYLILQVVTTKSQSGGLHYLQAIKFILFPTLALPPLLLTIFLGVRRAWVQTGFSIIILLLVLAAQHLVGVQFDKREELMLKKVEEYHLQPRILLLHSKNASQSGGGSSCKSMPDAPTSGQGTVGRVVGFTSNFPGISSDIDGEGLISEPHDYEEYDNEMISPRQRIIKKMVQRPTTIIGQYRNSLASTISGGARPKSVPVFDLERYEKEILGLKNEVEDLPSSYIDSGDKSYLGNGSLQRDSNNPSQQEKLHSRQSSLARAITIGHGTFVNHAGSSVDFEPRISFAEGVKNSALQDLFPEHPSSSRGAMVTESVLSRAKETELEKDAKYHEIVKALRRASSVASRKKQPESSADNENSGKTHTGAAASNNNQRRVRLVGASGFKGSSLEALNESQPTDQFARRANSNTTYTTNEASNNNNKTQFRTSLPTLINPHSFHSGNNAYHHQRSIDEALSSVSLTSDRSSRGFSNGQGAPPSLPMLLIHRETAVAAKEWSRIQGLYLNPVLQEAKTKVIVWLPSQTERSFWGASSASWDWLHRQGHEHGNFQQATGSFSVGTLTSSSFGYCKYHTALLRARESNDVHQLAISEASITIPESDQITGPPSSLVINMGETAEPSHTTPVQGRVAFGLSTSTLAPAQTSSPYTSNNICNQQQQLRQQNQQQQYPCTCLLYQEVVKAVADAVALADQEIRDLRIVGLTVWLDSRHVIWGQEKEEDGRLGDRVMISTIPSIDYGGDYLQHQQEQRRQVGDGLLSWLDVDDDTEVGEGCEGGDHSHLGTGAAGIIGGSMGIIMRRPIGYYGRLVGDGEEDDITRSLCSE